MAQALSEPAIRVSRRVLSKRRRMIRATIFATIFYIRQLVISGFLLRSFFLKLNGRACLPYRPYALPGAPYFKLLKLKWLWFRKIWASEEKAGYVQRLTQRHGRLIGQIEDYVEANGTVQTEEIPVPEYDWRNGSPEDFRRKFVVNPMPVVLRGFGLDTGAVQRWSFDSIVEKCGDVEVDLTGPTSDWLGPLKQVRDPNVYCASADAPFARFPELADELGIPKLQPYLQRTNTFNQFFIGRKATGSGFHCAGIWNFFMMIEGEKKWTFVDPELTWMMYPSIRVGAVAFSSLVFFPDQSDPSVYRLYKYCPRYSVHLKPGDVLFDPPWWWHTVENKTPTSVAVATRWDAMRRDASFYELNRMLSLIATVNRKFPRFLFEYLVDALGQGRLLMRAGAGALSEESRVEVKNQKARSVNSYQGRMVAKIAAREKW